MTTRALMACIVLFAAACGDATTEPADTSTAPTTIAAPATSATTPPPATTTPTTLPATTTPTTLPATTTSTTEPKPPVRAVGLVPLPGAQLDFTAAAVPNPSLVWSLFSGSGGIFVENVGGPLPPGCHGTSFFDPETFDLLQLDGKDLQAYATRGDGGCDGMQQDVGEGVVDGDAVRINTDELIVFDFGGLPDSPFDVSTQVLNADGQNGVFRAADPLEPLFRNDLTGASHVVGADVLLSVVPVTGEFVLVQPPRPVPGDCGQFDVCFHDRFGVDIINFEGTPGHVLVAGDGGGLFTFFDGDDWQALVRIVNGCQFNDHFWVFAAASTDVEYELTVTDTFSGTSRAYSSPLGTPAPPVVDTEAFATCP